MDNFGLCEGNLPDGVSRIQPLEPDVRDPDYFGDYKRDEEMKLEKKRPTISHRKF